MNSFKGLSETKVYYTLTNPAFGFEQRESSLDNQIGKPNFECVSVYNFLGIQIAFDQKFDSAFCFTDSTRASAFYHQSSKISKLIQLHLSTLADHFLNSSLCRLVTQGKLHALSHELGHAIASKILIQGSPRIKIANNCTGTIYLPKSYHQASPIAKTIINASGPLGNIIFCNLKLIATIALKHLLPKPLVHILALGTVLWMTGEVFYAYSTVKNHIYYDYGEIAERSRAHLMIATGFLVAGYACGILLSAQVFIN